MALGSMPSGRRLLPTHSGPESQLTAGASMRHKGSVSPWQRPALTEALGVLGDCRTGALIVAKLIALHERRKDLLDTSRSGRSPGLGNCLRRRWVRRHGIPHGRAMTMSWAYSRSS